MERTQQSFVARLKTADRRAAAELVDKYYQKIYLLFRRLGHSRQVSEDLTQETFLQAWQHIGQLRDAAALNSWLYRIAGNLSRLYWRRHRADKSTDEQLVYLADKGQADSGHFEELNRLREAVSGLSPKLKEAVVLHYMQHLTIAEAAKAAGISQGAFKSRLNRVLKALRKQLTSTK